MAAEQKWQRLVAAELAACMSVCVIVPHFLGVSFASIEPLLDGLLLTKTAQLQVQSAEWTIL